MRESTAAVTPSPADFEMEDEALLLAHWGYKQELRRIFSRLEVFGIGFNLVGPVPSLVSVLVFSIPGGGTHGMIWAWTVCGVFLTVVALSIAELASAVPTAAGMYSCAFLFSPPRYRHSLSWIVGYANMIGNIAGVASITWACATQIIAAANVGSGFMFQPTMAQIYGVYCALLLGQGIVCSHDPTIAGRLQRPFLLLNIAFWVALIIALPAASPKPLNTPKFVFGTFTNVNKAWSNNVFAFLLTFLSPLWAIGRATAAAHISEEARNPRTSVPYAVVVATAACAVMGWGLNVLLAFCMGKDLGVVLNDRNGEPLANILFNSFGKKGMLAVYSFLIILQFNTGTGLLTATSRQTFALARDSGLLLSRRISTVDKRTHAPVAAVWLPIILSALLGLLAFAGRGAINSMFALAVVGQYVAYIITIVGSNVGDGYSKSGKKGRFSLGIFSLPVAVIAVVFMSVLSVILMFPESENPSASNMNYTAPILGTGLLLSALVFYFNQRIGLVWLERAKLSVEKIDSKAKNSLERVTEDEKRTEGN